MRTDKEFTEALQSLPAATARELATAPESVRSNAREIRLRAGRKPCIVSAGQNYVFSRPMPSAELYECFRALCGYSVHTHTEEIRQGFLTVRGGHRAGLCGTAVYESGRMINLRGISSINLRIARQINGAADELMRRVGGDPGRLLVVGPPASGKTTLLKDIVRQLSGRAVSVVDTRSEIAACMGGVPQNDVGTADVFDGWERAEGMLAAIRTMSPDYIVCDEIGCGDDLRAVEACVGAGAQLIATAHAGTLDELCGRPVIRRILQTGAFDRVALLVGKDAPCKVHSVHKAGDLLAHVGRTAADLLSYSARFRVLDQADAGKTGAGADSAND